MSSEHNVAREDINIEVGTSLCWDAVSVKSSGADSSIYDLETAVQSQGYDWYGRSGGYGTTSDLILNITVAADVLDFAERAVDLYIRSRTVWCTLTDNV